MKQILLIGCLALAGAGADAETLTVKTFDYYGPYALTAPLMVDSVDVDGSAFSEALLSGAPATLRLKGTPSKFSGIAAPGS